MVKVAEGNVVMKLTNQEVNGIVFVGAVRWILPGLNTKVCGKAHVAS